MIGKRGEAIVETIGFHLYDILLVAFLIGLGLMYAASLRDNTLFEQNYLAKDVGLMAFTIYHLPGDLEYSYTFDDGKLSKYSFSMNDKKIKVTNIKTGFSVEKQSLFLGTARIESAEHMNFIKLDDRVDIK